MAFVSVYKQINQSEAMPIGKFAGAPASAIEAEELIFIARRGDLSLRPVAVAELSRRRYQRFHGSNSNRKKEKRHAHDRFTGNVGN
jgi:hypothetical protein